MTMDNNYPRQHNMRPRIVKKVGYYLTDAEIFDISNLGRLSLAQAPQHRRRLNQLIT